MTPYYAYAKYQVNILMYVIRTCLHTYFIDFPQWGFQKRYPKYIACNSIVQHSSIGFGFEAMKRTFFARGTSSDFVFFLF